MAKFDVFVTMLDIEHTTVNAENEEEARAKVDRYLGRLMEEGIMDPMYKIQTRNQHIKELNKVQKSKQTKTGTSTE